MLRLCYKGKIDMIIVKSISRFTRNALDVIKITRKLREINVNVYFEEQGIHSIVKWLPAAAAQNSAHHGSIKHNGQRKLQPPVKTVAAIYFR